MQAGSLQKAVYCAKKQTTMDRRSHLSLKRNRLVPVAIYCTICTIWYHMALYGTIGTIWYYMHEIHRYGTILYHLLKKDSCSLVVSSSGLAPAQGLRDPRLLRAAGRVLDVLFVISVGKELPCA